jgi:hypothetical protein
MEVDTTGKVIAAHKPKTKNAFLVTFIINPFSCRETLVIKGAKKEE